MLLATPVAADRGPRTPALAVGRADTVEAHGLRVERCARMLAREHGLPAVDCEEITLAGRLHDVGKVRLPRSLLTKASPLDPDELALMRTHPELGASMLAPTGASSTVTEIVRHHHERWDGSGYPLGLAGRQIALGARVVAVADTFDAMVSNRPYRPAAPREHAVRELLRVRGTHLDPALVETFVRVLGKARRASLPAR